MVEVLKYVAVAVLSVLILVGMKCMADLCSSIDTYKMTE